MCPDEQFVNDQPLQPDATDSPEETADLEAQVDELLVRISQQVPEAVADPGSADDSPDEPKVCADDEARAENADCAGRRFGSEDAAGEDAGGPADRSHFSDPQPMRGTGEIDEWGGEESLDIDKGTSVKSSGFCGEGDSPESAFAPESAPQAEVSSVQGASLEQDIDDNSDLAQQIQDLLDRAQAEAEGLAEEVAASEDAAAGAVADLPSDVSSVVADAAAVAAVPQPEADPVSIEGEGIEDSAQAEPLSPEDADVGPATSAGDVASGQSRVEVPTEVADASASGPYEYPPAQATAGDAEGSLEADGTAKADFSDPMAAAAQSTEQGEDACAGGADVASAETEGQAIADAATFDSEDQEVSSDDQVDLEGDPQLIHRIDQMLADEVEDKLADEFESVREIVQEDDHRRDDEAAEAESPVSESPVSPVARDASGTLAEASHVGAGGGPTDSVTEGATAADVAAELDDQPETRRTDQTGAAPASVPSSASPVSNNYRRALAGLARGTRHVCGLVNAPLYRFSSDVRSTIGWIGVLTIFNALCLLVFSLIR